MVRPFGIDSVVLLGILLLLFNISLSCSILAQKTWGFSVYIYINLIFTLILLLIIPSQKNRLVRSPLRYECRKRVEGWSALDVATPLLAPWPFLTFCTHFQWLANENPLVTFSEIDVFTTTINTTRNCMKISLFTKKFMTSLL